MITLNTISNGFYCTLGKAYMDFLPPSLTVDISCFLVESRTDQWWWNKAFLVLGEGKGGVDQGRSRSCTEFTVPHSSSICSFHPKTSNALIFPTPPLARGHSPWPLPVQMQESLLTSSPHLWLSPEKARLWSGYANQCLTIFCTCPPPLHAFAHTVCPLSIPYYLRTRELTLVKDLLKRSLFKNIGEWCVPWITSIWEARTRVFLELRSKSPRPSFCVGSTQTVIYEGVCVYTYMCIIGQSQVFLRSHPPFILGQYLKNKPKTVLRARSSSILPLIPALHPRRQTDLCEFKVSQGYIRPCLKKKKKKKKTQTDRQTVLLTQTWSSPIWLAWLVSKLQHPLPSTGIASVYHCILSFECWRSNPGPHAWTAST